MAKKVSKKVNAEPMNIGKIISMIGQKKYEEQRKAELTTKYYESRAKT